jgi:hypothetical protein
LAGRKRKTSATFCAWLFDSEESRNAPHDRSDRPLYQRPFEASVAGLASASIDFSPALVLRARRFKVAVSFKGLRKESSTPLNPRSRLSVVCGSKYGTGSDFDMKYTRMNY